MNCEYFKQNTEAFNNMITHRELTQCFGEESNALSTICSRDLQTNPFADLCYQNTPEFSFGEENFFVNSPKSKVFEEYVEEINQKDRITDFDRNINDWKCDIDFDKSSQICSISTFNIKKCEEIQKVTSSHKQAGSKKKAKRWGKKNDIELFKAFRTCEEQGLISLEQLEKFESDSDACDHQGILTIKRILECPQTPQFLCNRIKIKIKDSFSVRDTKTLKKEIKKYSYKNINYSALLPLFPGRSLAALKKACDSICENKKAKNLNKICRI